MSPDNFTLEERMLEVGSGHRLYVHRWGSKDAPEDIIFLHGGPGSGCSDRQKTLFDPTKQRVVFFDQRGSGKSQPYGSLQYNTTDDLVEDINKVSVAFGIKSFTLTGGSWGSCLALTYAIRYPAKVRRMVLRGLFTGRQSEIDFLNKGEVQRFFPEVWEQFSQSVPSEYRNDPATYHLPRILGSDPLAAKESAYAFARLEGAVVKLDDRSSIEVFEHFDPVPTTIECHYLAHACFLPEGYILKNATALTMPIQLVQGRYDFVCPPYTAYELAQKLPNASLTWTTAGHLGHDRANWEVVRALLQTSATQ